MKILIDIGHPAHVHLFKHFAWEMQRKGNVILFTARDKEMSLDLLKKYDFEFVTLGKPYLGMINKLKGLVKFNYHLLRIAKNFEPDLFLSHGSIYAAQVSYLLRKPHISLEDTGNMEQIRLYRPFTKIILSPSCIKKNLGEKQIFFDGYHELSYLHPNHFQPDSSILDGLNIKKGEKFVVLRFVSWGATHDRGHRGISLENKIYAVKEFSKCNKVFISTEGDLPEDLEKFKIPIPPERMHDVLYFASLYYGEGATMASECAVLGTPAIFLNDNNIDCTIEQEKKYGLVFNFSESNKDQLKSIEKAKELLSMNNIKGEFMRRRNKLFNDKIDVTAFMIWFVENYPLSFELMREKPNEIQKQFKGMKS